MGRRTRDGKACPLGGLGQQTSTVGYAGLGICLSEAHMRRFAAESLRDPWQVWNRRNGAD